MRARQLAAHPGMVLAAPLLFAAMVAGVAPAAPAGTAARPWVRGPAAGFSTGGSLTGVAATSATNAWAVGYTGTTRHKALILH